jgi:hypothetical protein
MLELIDGTCFAAGPFFGSHQASAHQAVPMLRRHLRRGGGEIFPTAMWGDTPFSGTPRMYIYNIYICNSCNYI